MEPEAVPTSSEIKIGPQPGPQEAFLESVADILLYGGAAGGGKTWCLLYEPIRHIDTPDFGGVIFRRTSPQITNEGALWDKSMGLYPYWGATPLEGPLAWDFPANPRIRFAHLEHENDKLSWQGSEICYIGFDELTHFSRSQFFYMLSRNRSLCGIRPYVRATCNPDPDSWLAEFIEWWLDEAGDPIPERSGVIRWFVMVNDAVMWADSEAELKAQYPDRLPKSFTFIPAKITDNKILMSKDPGYLANLQALSKHEQAALLGGNWKTRASKGDFFKRGWVEVIDEPMIPYARFLKTVRFWDRASTNPLKQKPGKKLKDPDWTVGAKIAVTDEGFYYVLDIVRFRDTPAVNQTIIKNTTIQDGKAMAHRMEEEGGSSGKDTTDNYARKVLAGFDFLGVRSTGPKEDRFNTFSAAAQNGLVRVKRSRWNDAYFSELEGLWDPEQHDDQADATSGAFNELAKYYQPAQALVINRGGRVVIIGGKKK